MKLLIIGGVAGGASAAAKARRSDEFAEITIIEKGDYLSYANCGLPYYPAGLVKSVNQLVLKSPADFEKTYNVKVMMNTEAIGLDREAKQLTVKTKDGQTKKLDYDKLIIATGLVPFDFKFEGLETIDTFKLLTVNDSIKLHDYVVNEKPKNALVLGSGFIGVEVADALVERGIKVDMVDMAPRVMPRMDKHISIMLEDKMKENGISLYLNTTIAKIEKIDNKTFKATLKNGTVLEANLFIMAVGGRPASDFVKDVGLNMLQNGCIKVNQYCQTNDPNIYAVGDVASKVNFFTGEDQPLYLAAPASRQGRIAGEHATTGKAQPMVKVLGASIVNFRDVAASNVGLTRDEAKKLYKDVKVAYITKGSAPEYMPQHGTIYGKVVYDFKTRFVLGAAFFGPVSIDKRADLFSLAITHKITIDEFADFEHHYAPQFNSPRDVTHIAAMIAEHAELEVDPEDILKDEVSKCSILDVRNHGEVSDSPSAFCNSTHLPLPELRSKCDTIKKDDKLYVHCKSGYRSYLSTLILRMKDYKAFSISGGDIWLKLISRGIERGL